MNKTNCLLEIFCVSGILGIISNFLGSIEMSYIVLLVLLMIDTFTGMAAAFKYRRFTSKGLCKFSRKVITYTTSIITVKLLELGVISLVKTNLLSHLMVSFLLVTETISILENLAILGVPIPSNFIKFLLNHLKIPGLESAINMSINEDKSIMDIEEMIKYQIPAIKNSDMRRMLEIKFEVWRGVAYQIQHLLQGNQKGKDDLIYYKTLSLIEAAYKEIQEYWKEEKIPQDLIDHFNHMHQPKINRWLQKIKTICYSEESVNYKKQQIIDSLVVLLFQTILDAHREVTDEIYY